MPKNRLMDLRNHLFETLESLRDDSKKVEDEIRRARAVCDVSKAIIESAKVEVNYAKACNADVGTDFFDGTQSRPRPALNNRPALRNTGAAALPSPATAVPDVLGPEPRSTGAASPGLDFTRSERERNMQATLNNPMYCADCMDAGHKCIATSKDEDNRPSCVFCLDGEPCLVEQRKQEREAERAAVRT